MCGCLRWSKWEKRLGVNVTDEKPVQERRSGIIEVSGPFIRAASAYECSLFFDRQQRAILARGLQGQVSTGTRKNDRPAQHFDHPPKGNGVKQLPVWCVGHGEEATWQDGVGSQLPFSPVTLSIVVLEIANTA